MHHFHMANIETERRRQVQPPVHRPPPIVVSPPPAETNQPTSTSFSSAAPSMTFTMVTQVEQHAPVREASRGSSYTDAVKGGKRPTTSHTVHDMEISEAPQPKQDMRNRNMNLLDPNYSPNDGQVQRAPTPNSLQTPRPQYSPITPTEVQRYLSPGTPCLHGPSNAEQDDFHPSNHLSRLTTRTFETSNDETALECAKHMLGLQ